MVYMIYMIIYICEKCDIWVYNICVCSRPFSFTFPANTKTFLTVAVETRPDDRPVFSCHPPSTLPLFLLYPEGIWVSYGELNSAKKRNTHGATPRPCRHSRSVAPCNSGARWSPRAQCLDTPTEYHSPGNRRPLWHFRRCGI